MTQNHGGHCAAISSKESLLLPGCGARRSTVQKKTGSPARCFQRKTVERIRLERETETSGKELKRDPESVFQNGQLQED